MEALPYIMTLLIVLFVFSFIIIGTVPSNVVKINGAVVMIVSIIGLGVGMYFKIIEEDQTVKQKNERLAYNEKKQEELLKEKLKLPITDILIEPVSKTEYYKVTTNTGIYKLAYAYDPNDRVTGFKEFKQITSTIN
ncbi:TPA: hypothetical protein ACTZ5S_005463 [Bacillus cereus]|uniref:hypothetical protein n=1 Tax=Bacillus TaxID=1386 RepID=UPI002FEF6BF3